jgi:hypothetical protein
MKEAELRKRANCSRCKKKIGELRLPIFTALRAQDYIVDLPAVQRQQGLGLMIGGFLAMHMGPDEDMAIPGSEANDLTLCAHCRFAFYEWLENV